MKSIASIVALPSKISVLERTRRFAELVLEVAERADATATIEPRVWSTMSILGLGLSPLPETFGGDGLVEPERWKDLSDVLRLLGSADLSVARLFEGHINAITLVCRYGTDAQQCSLAASIAQGALSAVWGADDAFGLQLRENGVLDGRKVYASGAGLVTRPLVIANSSNEQIMCLLELTTNERADVSGWTAQGMRSTATGAVDLTGIAVGSNEIIGKAGDFTRQPHFSGGAWRFCAAQIGAVERLVEHFRDHMVSKGRGDDPYQLQRFAQIVASAKTARFWAEDVGRRLSLPDAEPVETVALANLTRMVTERVALDTIEAVQRGVGLQSLLRPHPIERVCRDLSTYLRQPVPDLAMRDAAKTFLNFPNLFVEWHER